MGNGSSGVQIVPALQPSKNILNFGRLSLTPSSEVKSLVQFVRSPTWMVPAQRSENIADILSNIEMDGFNFTPNQIEKFKASPEYYLKFVKAVEAEINSKFPIVSPSNPPTVLSAH
jgi:cation diffusion facilitator CzcD-associated flavoprotein CzcO